MLKRVHLKNLRWVLPIMMGKEIWSDIWVGNTPGNCAVRNCAVEHTHLIFTREGNGRIWPSAIPYWVQWCRKSIWRSPKLHSHPCGSPNFLHMCIVYSPNDINHAVCTHIFFVFLHFIFTKMELLTHEAKIKGKHLASLELFLQSSIKIPLSGKKCLQLLYNSWTLISDLTARLSSWCSSRPQACTSCETISVVEVLVDLVVVLQVLESLDVFLVSLPWKGVSTYSGLALPWILRWKAKNYPS